MPLLQSSPHGSLSIIGPQRAGPLVEFHSTSKPSPSPAHFYFFFSYAFLSNCNPITINNNRPFTWFPLIASSLKVFDSFHISHFRSLFFFFLSWDLEQALVFYSCHVFLFSFSTRSSGRVDLGRGCQPVIVRILEFVSWLEPEARTWMRSRVGDDVRWLEPAFFPWLVEHGRAAVGAISHGYTR